jgi:hypothetical protein
VDSDDVEALLADGDGTFGSHQLYTMSGLAALGDFDLDGRPDLLGAWEWTHDVSISINQSGPRAFTFDADGITLVWPGVTGALSYDIYRGDLSALVDGDDDGLPDSGYGTCMTALDDDPRDTFFEDGDVPAVGGGFFYLRAVINAQGDGGIGSTSAGLPRTPQVPCP